MVAPMEAEAGLILAAAVEVADEHLTHPGPLLGADVALVALPQ
jgi:hypothetical protein